MRHSFKLFLLTALVTLTACVSTGGTQIDESKLQSFQKGKTTYAEVVAALGSPLSDTRSSSGERSVTYSYTRVQGSAANFIPVVGAFTQSNDSQSKTWIFNFDKHDILSDSLISTSNTSAQSGVGAGRKN
jgi:outer membrane protein assembly factor BamE (lipoprotein component of BamABCDE complex)